jgi:broad specificity phosphatase PhoE
VRHATRFLVVLLLAAVPAAALDTIYVVRHAEKAEGWLKQSEADSFWPLSPAGERRAQALATRLGDAGVGAIYTSATTRAIATAVPLVNAKEIPLTIDDASIHREDMRQFFDRLRQQHASARAVLVVGHSNTVPQLLATLGATPECHQRLGIVESEGTPLIEGHEGLWKVNLATSGCEGIIRETLTAGR